MSDNIFCEERIPEMVRTNLIINTWYMEEDSKESKIKQEEFEFEYHFNDVPATIAAVNALLVKIPKDLQQEGEFLSIEQYKDEEEVISINDFGNYKMLPPGDIVCFYQFKMNAPYDGCWHCPGQIFFLANRDIQFADWKIVGINMPGKYGEGFIRYCKRNGFWSYDVKDEPTGPVEAGLTMEHWRMWTQSNEPYIITMENVWSSRPVFFGDPAVSHGMSGNTIKSMVEMNEFSEYKFLWKCECCDRYTGEQPSGFTGSIGLGGIGIELTGPYCDICAVEAACSNCGCVSKGYLESENCYDCGQRCYCCEIFDKRMTTDVIDLLIEVGALDGDTLDEHGACVAETMTDDIENEEMIERKVRFKNPLEWACDTAVEVKKIDEVTARVCPACDYAHQLLEDKEEYEKKQFSFGFEKGKGA